MKLSQTAMEAFDRIKAKIEIKAIDFKGTQLDDLAIVYHEVTLLATGKGRVLSKGCTGCIPPAVHICYNYLQTIQTAQVIEPEKEIITVEIDEWADLTKAELWEQLKKRNISAPAATNKKKLIEILNGGK